jgi:hypothetical protein
VGLSFGKEGVEDPRENDERCVRAVGSPPNRTQAAAWAFATC